MKIRDERKLITIEATAAEMNALNESEWADVGPNNTIVDLDVYQEYNETPVKEIEDILLELHQNCIEADVVQVFWNSSSDSIKV